MLKLRAHELVILGLTDRELMLLTQRRAVLTGASDLGLPVRLAIIHGSNEEALVESVRGFGLPIPPMHQQTLIDVGGLTHSVTMISAEDVERTMRALERTQIAPERRPNSKGGSA